MNICDLPFLLETNDGLEVFGGSNKSSKFSNFGIISPNGTISTPPGIPEGSKLIDVACTNSFPSSCTSIFKTPDGSIVTYSPPVQPIDYNKFPIYSDIAQF
jgi:hypothetical protein